MRGAFGKPIGKVARVKIGQVLYSIRVKEANRAAACESLRRAKFKFPGRQQVVVSRKYGFTKVNYNQYDALKAEGKLRPDGLNVQLRRSHGPLKAIGIN